MEPETAGGRQGRVAFWRVLPVRRLHRHQSRAVPTGVASSDRFTRRRAKVGLHGPPLRCDAASNTTFFGSIWEMLIDRVAFRAFGI